MARKSVLVLVSLIAAIVAIFVAVTVGQAVAAAQTVPTEDAASPDQPRSTDRPIDQAPRPEVDQAVDTEPDPSTSAVDEEPGPTPTRDEQEADTEPEPTDEPSVDVDPSENENAGVKPSVRRSAIPVGTVVLAVGVLILVVLAAFIAGRQARIPDPSDEWDPRGPAPPTPPPSPSTGHGPPADQNVITFLIELGEALIDAGDSVNSVDAKLRAVADVHGITEMGVVVLPTALILSVPGTHAIQTNVTGAGTGPLRLDQIEAVLRIVDMAKSGELEAGEGRIRLAEIRTSSSAVSGPLTLAGHALSAVGLALVLRGGILEVGLAGVLGAAVGVYQIVPWRRKSSFQPFLPLVASFTIATAVFLVARAAPGLTILPPLVAPLIPFLPGALLTMGTLELATGQALSGVGRLGLGAMQLVLLAGGILGAVQFVGIPGPTRVAAATATPGWLGPADVLLPWIGVALFGLGIVWARAARRSSAPWILLVLFVAYAGQIIGGLFFGSALSAFFGAVAMTPVGVHLARRHLGPPSLVMFLPAFWLLVPGALGLEGVTRVLGEQGLQGIQTLVTTGTAMVGIALGILLGLLVADPES